MILMLVVLAASISHASIRKLSPNGVVSKSRLAASVGAGSVLSPKPLGTDAEKLLSATDCIIFDCDGVIWRGDSLIDKVPAVLERLRALGKRIFFVTNNSTKSRKGYLKKFTGLGLAVNAEEIFSSSFAAAAYFEKFPLSDGKKVYVIGQEGIGEELDLIGVPHFGGPSDSSKSIKLGPGVKVEHDEDVGAVVVGFDQNINYYKIQYAQLCINENPGCRFIATNLDAVTHLTDEQEWAGNGAMVGAVAGCTGRAPIVVGKPAALMIDYIVDKFQLQREKILMVGDRLDTDVAFGRDNGLRTLLVLSGVTDADRLAAAAGSSSPEYFADSIAAFFPDV